MRDDHFLPRPHGTWGGTGKEERDNQEDCDVWFENHKGQKI